MASQPRSHSQFSFYQLPEVLQEKIMGEIITFPTKPVSFRRFFSLNQLHNDRYRGCTFILTGTRGNTKILHIVPPDGNYDFSIYDIRYKRDIADSVLQYASTASTASAASAASAASKLSEGHSYYRDDVITRLEIKYDEKIILSACYK
jgi:hypothetical protein